MSAGEPQIRASYAKTVIGSVKKLPAAASAAVLARIGDGTRAQIREYGMLDWMPASDFVAIVRNIEEAQGGPKAAHAFWRDCLRASLDRRLLAPLRMGAIAVYGKSPGSLLKMTPQAWDLVSKHCGACVTVDQPPNGILLRFSELPVVMRVSCMAALWSGGSESCIARMGATGKANARAEQLREGRMDIVVAWQ